MRLSFSIYNFPVLAILTFVFSQISDSGGEVDPGNLKPSTRPLIIAHRGASASAPENTLPAFRLAWELKADAIEGDFHMTSDGQIVCIHDKDTQKVTGKKHKLVVKDTPLAELRKLDVGSWFGEKWKDTKTPTLLEVLATVPKNKKIYVEIKCGPEVLAKLHEDLHASGLSDDQIVLISFNPEVVKRYKSREPKRKAYWLTGIGKNKKGLREPTLAKVLETLRATGADGVGSSGSALVDRKFVHDIQKAGFEYHVWTIDDPEAARHFRTLGAGSITTNKPGLIRKELFNVEAKQTP